MIISAPIYRLKSNARKLARRNKVPLHQALDEVAQDQGYKSWSHLAHARQPDAPARRLLAALDRGDLMVLAARPGEGKTMLGLEVAAEAAKAGRPAFFFSSECSRTGIERLLSESGYDSRSDSTGLVCDLPDRISAGHVMAVLSGQRAGAIGVIDYLQVMDQHREDPPLGQQIESLKAFAVSRVHALVFLSQIHRSFDPARKPLPDFDDLRSTNPLELSQFTKGSFLGGGELALRRAPGAA